MNLPLLEARLLFLSYLLVTAFAGLGWLSNFFGFLKHSPSSGKTIIVQSTSNSTSSNTAASTKPKRAILSRPSRLFGRTAKLLQIAQFSQNSSDTIQTISDLRELLAEVENDSNLKKYERVVLKGRLSARLGQQLLHQGQPQDALVFLKKSLKCLEYEMEQYQQPGNGFYVDSNTRTHMHQWRLRLGEDISRCLSLLGKYAVAEKHWRACLDERLKNELGAADQLNLAQCREGLGMSLQCQGLFCEAEELLKEALISYKEALEQKVDKDTLHMALFVVCKVHIVENLMMRSKFHDAQVSLMDILELLEQRKKDGFDDMKERVSTSELLVLLGFCLQQQGMMIEAQQAQWQAFNQVEKANNDNQLSLQELLSTAAVAYQRNGFVKVPNTANKLGMPDALLRSSLERERKKFGPGDPRVAPLLANAAWAHFIAGRSDEAESLMREALALKQPDDPSRADILHRLGSVLTSTERFEEAEAVLQESLSIFLSEEVMNMPYASSTMTLIGRCLMNKGRNEEAVGILRKAIAMQEAMYGQQSFQFVQSMYTLAEVYANMGNVEEAEHLFKKILLIWEEYVPSNAQSLITHSRMCLAGIFLAQDKDDEALVLLRDAVCSLGVDHPESVHAMGIYASALVKAKREEEALDITTQALNLRTQDGALIDAPECINLLLVMGQIHRLKDESRQAEERLRQSLSMAERIFGLKSPYTARIMLVLSDCIRTEPGCLSEADELARKAKKILEEIEKNK